MNMNNDTHDQDERKPTKVIIAERIFEALSETDVTLVTAEAQKRMTARHLLSSLSEGLYHELPIPVLEEVRGFAKACLAAKQSSAVLALRTTGKGLIMFLVEFVMTRRGVEISPPLAYSIPDYADDDSILPEFQGMPVLAIDVTVGI